MALRQPSRRAWAVVALFVAPLTFGVLLSPAVATGGTREAAVPTSSVVTMVSEAGDWVGHGESRIWQAPDDAVSVRSTDQNVQVSVSGADSDFTLSFGPRTGHQLVPGLYSGARAFPTPDHPWIDISGDGRGCTSTGRFWVLDYAQDLSRVWIVYEQHCDGAIPELFGEVRIGEPDAPPVQLSPTRIQWDYGYPGAARRPVPVHVRNTGSDPLTVGHAAVVVGTPDYSVLANSCTTALTPGQECTIDVGFTPSRAGTRAGELRIDTSAGVRWVPLTGSGIKGRTSWDMHSPPGNWIAGGRDFAFTPMDGTYLTADGTESLAEAAVDTGSDKFIATFKPSAGHALLTGSTFDDVTNTPGSPSAWLEVSGDGAGCMVDHGWFTVDDSAFDTSGNLSRFRIRFAQYCSHETEPLTGTIAWHEPDPDAPDPDATAPQAVKRLSAQVGASGLVTLTWRNPHDTDWVDTEVRVRRGSSAPVWPTKGQEVYAGRGRSTVIQLPVGRAHYSFSVFTRDTSGNTRRQPLLVDLPAPGRDRS